MHIHILGICGTFMGGVAALAREAGHKVTGCDANVYPPMSSQLEALGIELIQGFGAGAELAGALTLVAEYAPERRSPGASMLASRKAFCSGTHILDLLANGS